MLKFYNTLSRKKEIFKALKDKKVGLYTCGPTVYWYAHIGNLRTYIFEDLLRRVLEYNGYQVKHIMNITDVGHLTSESDTGEDKIEVSAKREKKTVWEIAEFYTKAFKKDLKLLNIKEPYAWIKATDTIKEQIDLIKILEAKGFAYVIEDGVYFDTSKLKDYGKLTGLKKQKLKPGARIKIIKGKKNITDFALWKFTPKKTKRQMEWSSPWSRGFPGWHTECVVMGIKNLGIPFDIHCGGIDHISIHHPNEIAQAQAAYNKILANFWLHGEFLILPKGKMSKSKGNVILINSLAKKGFNPLAYRYLNLTAHYRSPLKFSWKSLQAAQNALNNLYNAISNLKAQSSKPRRYLTSPSAQSKIDKNLKFQILKNKYKAQFLNFINDDLNIPKSLALMWRLVKDEKLPNQEKYKLLLNFDKIFGLGLKKIKKEKIPKQVLELAKEREKDRKKGNWRKADKIRIKIKKMGYLVEDTEKGAKIKCKT